MSLTPTPHYNSIILYDLIMSETNSQNTALIKEYPNIRDGIILLKIWLSQRQLIKGYDSFSSHIMTMYVLYLLKIKKLNTFMSSYQIVRNVWCNLGKILFINIIIIIIFVYCTCSIDIYDIFYCSAKYLV